MNHLSIKYQFSKKSFTFSSLILFILISILTTLIVSFYADNIGVAIFFVLLLIFFLIITLPRYIVFFYSIFKNIPAVVISENEFIDNINNRTYMWSEIKEIAYRKNEGKNAFGSYTEITFNESDTVIQIPHNAIKCKTTDFLNDLIKYHKKYKNKYQKIN